MTVATSLLAFSPKHIGQAKAHGVSLIPDISMPRPVRDTSKFVERLDVLTTEDEERMKALREKWIDRALCTEPMGVAGAIAGIIETYRDAQKPEPRQVIHASSPLQGVCYAFLVQEYADGLDAIRYNVPCAEIDDNMDLPAPEQPRPVDAATVVPAEFHDLMRWYTWTLVTGIRDCSLADLDAATDPGGRVAAQISRRAEVLLAWMFRELDRIRAALPARVRDQLACIFWGSHEASWMSFYQFFEPYFDFISAVLGLIEIAQHAGWTWFYHGIAVVSERPRIIARDDQMRLHNPDGPALGYEDKFGVYMLSGIRIEPWIINNPERINFANITAEQNVEIRRLMIKRMGFDRFIRESGATLVHEDTFGSLYRIELEGDEPYVLVQVTNSTPEPDGTYEKYVLRVPPDMKTAHQAVAWTFKRTPETYFPVYES